jgi:HD-GYP domain-containing protein (c-di-GMP phosphodiesterase class II)
MESVKIVYIKDLRVGMFIADPVYAGKVKRGAMLIAGNTLVTDERLIERLEKSGIKTVKIDVNKGLEPIMGQTAEEIKKKVAAKKALEITSSDTMVSNTLLDQRKWDEIVETSKGQVYAGVVVTKLINQFTNSVTKIFSKNITSRCLLREDTVMETIKEILHFIGNHVDILRAAIKLNELNEYTFSHSVNTMVLTVSLAHFLKYSQADIKRFGIAVMLADLGMSNYHKKLTLRPSGLSQAEMSEINKHPLFSVEFLKNNELNDPFVNMLIIQHHERWDGSGYPYGLKGEEINPVSRLFAVADVYDAMTSLRPYRPAIPPHIALAEILKLSGIQFDSKMANLFIKYIGVFPMGSMV